ncbi:MAG: peptidyl-prolyl cis-trans isomerase [Desulfovibrionaceae bacterium]|nr:peptidyl-prolyl cis-trans isomerase [Desulfovibrionaceae bacterium]MBF0514758.1 peptidyl-prolyl cis-trans isomerase [Desulfovibrionaceae bacterium]
MVRLETSMGDITIALFPDRAPLTVANFLSYVKSGFYDGLIFHRVIPGFMIQGGGLTPDMQEKPKGKPIKNEAPGGLKNEAYTVAMARTGDPDSATCQFFINTVDNASLNYATPTPQGYGYAVFGKVIAGRETVDKIKAVRTSKKGPYEDVPATPVVIKKASVVTQ